MPSQRWRPCFGTLPESSHAALQQLASGQTLRLAKLGELSDLQMANELKGCLTNSAALRNL